MPTRTSSPHPHPYLRSFTARTAGSALPFWLCLGGLAAAGCGDTTRPDTANGPAAPAAATTTLTPVQPAGAAAGSGRTDAAVRSLATDETLRRELFALVRAVLDGRDPAPPTALTVAAGEPQRVVVSLGRPDATALVGQGSAASVAAAARAAAAEIAGRPERATASGLLKIDLVTRTGAPQPVGTIPSVPADYAPGLDGLWFAAAELLLLPEEIQARDLVDDGLLEPDRLLAYLGEGGRARAADAAALTERALAERAEIHRVRLLSLFDDAGEPTPLVRGNREIPGTSPDALLAASRAGGEFLLRHQTAGGLFAYQYRAPDDAFDGSDNLVRQAGTSYALVELAEATGDARFRVAAERALGALLVYGRPGPATPTSAGGGTSLAITEETGEAKLGASALALLALTRCRAAGGCADQVAAMRSLAAYVVSQQRPDGSFVSKIDLETGEVDDFDSIYYPGEAILALLRLARLEPDGPWAAPATRGARWLITVRDGGKSDAELPHDHWLLMGLAELHQREPLNPLWSDHARRIAGAIVSAQLRAATQPDWIGGYYEPPRSTPTATRGEGLVAMAQIARLRGDGDATWIEAMRLGAEFQLRCQLFPESSLYLRRPDRALGGMRKGLTGWSVRIDYVQHSISAFLGLRALTLEQP